MTVAIDLFGNDIVNYSSSKWDKWEQETDKPYCKIYQLKLTEVLTYNRYRREQQTYINRERFNTKQSINYRLNEQRLHKEYMNHVRERTKAHAQDIIANYKKKSNTYSIKAKQPIALSVTTNNISPVLESRPKCTSKTKLPPLPIRSERLKSPSVDSEKSMKKFSLTPIMKNDEDDDILSTANNYSFTEATSSSSRRHHCKQHYNARQTILDAIMAHLNSYKSFDNSKGPNYEDIKYKFASSISPHVYESFERLVA
ncbi:unnamed protein product [Rotaria magnacalcarata]|nr:unnamed protein product [Rotaria magnacalcarata]